MDTHGVRVVNTMEKKFYPFTCGDFDAVERERFFDEGKEFIGVHRIVANDGGVRFSSEEDGGLDRFALGFDFINLSLGEC